VADDHPDTISPEGNRLVTITAEEYQHLIGENVDTYLEAATPLAFWRRHRGTGPRGEGSPATGGKRHGLARRYQAKRSLVTVIQSARHAFPASAHT
jgi:hypothetical protein